MIEQYKESLISIITMIVRGCDTYQALLCLGDLVVIVNNGIVYSINVADMFPLELKMTIYYRTTTTGSIMNVGFDEELAYQINNRTAVLFNQAIVEQILYHDDDFSQNELFEKMRNSKVEEGQFKFILDSNEEGKIILILYKGVFNLAKADKMSLTIYDKSYIYGAPRGTRLMCVYNIYKKKLNKQYQIRTLVLNLWKDRRISHGITTE